MDRKDRVYYVRRSAEELENALIATDAEAAEAHRRLQRAYLERALIGNRPVDADEMVG